MWGRGRKCGAPPPHRLLPFLLQGFNQEDLDADKKESKERPQVEESDSDEGVERGGQE